MNKTTEQSNRTHFEINELVSTCILLTAGTLTGMGLYISKLNSFIHSMVDSGNAVSHGYIALFSSSITTTGNTVLHCFNWGAVFLFLLMAALILLDYCVKSEITGRKAENE